MLHLVYMFQRWVKAFMNPVLYTLFSTTNGLERQHEKLKYTFLYDVSNGSLTDVLTVIVKSFVPATQRRLFSHCR